MDIRVFALRVARRDFDRERLDETTGSKALVAADSG